MAPSLDPQNMATTLSMLQTDPVEDGYTRERGTGFAEWMVPNVSLTKRYSGQIRGVLSCFDRIVVTGTIPGICYADGMSS